MDRVEKLLPLTLALIILAGVAASISFNIEVSSNTSKGVYDVRYSESTSDFQEINMTVENFGSIGCEFRLAGEFEKTGEIENSYSAGYALWPGKSSFMQLKYMPINYTGPVNSTIYIEYCGQRDKVDSFVFNATENKTIPENNIESREISANSSQAEITVKTDDGYLVPQNTPGGWKVATVDVKDGVAHPKYDAPLFSKKTNLTYAVIDSSGEIKGTTNVNLDVEPTLGQKIRQNIWKILLALSILINIVLFSGRGLVKEKLNL